MLILLLTDILSDIIQASFVNSRMYEYWSLALLFFLARLTDNQTQINKCIVYCTLPYLPSSLP